MVLCKRGLPSNAGAMRSWTIAAVTFFAAAAVARLIWCPAAARRALLDQQPRHQEWHISCFVARLLVPAGIAVIVVVIIGLQGEALPLDAGGVLLGLAIGVLGNHLDRQFAGGWNLWKERERSLGSALPTFPFRPGKP
jgi:energy-converting hydrogenase Eha subunit A